MKVKEGEKDTFESSLVDTSKLQTDRQRHVIDQSAARIYHLSSGKLSTLTTRTNTPGSPSMTRFTFLMQVSTSKTMPSPSRRRPDLMLLLITFILLQLRTTIATTSFNKQISSTTSKAMSTNTKSSQAAPTTTKFAFLSDLHKKYPHQPVFLQAVEEMALSIEPLFSDPVNGEFYKRAFLYMTEPERMISFHVPWMDDGGVLHVNRGWRVEFSRYVLIIGESLLVCLCSVGLVVILNLSCPFFSSIQQCTWTVQRRSEVSSYRGRWHSKVPWI